MGKIVRGGVEYGGTGPVDKELSTTSTNPVQNNKVTEKINKVEAMEGDAWNNTKVYEKDAYCIHNDKLWKCNTQHSGVEPIEGSSHWTSVNVINEISKINSDLTECSSFIDGLQMKLYSTEAFNKVVDVDNPPQAVIVAGWQWKNIPANYSGGILINISYLAKMSSVYDMQLFFTSTGTDYALYFRAFKASKWILLGTTVQS